MNAYKILTRLALLAVVAVACDDSEDRLSNPHYSTGGKDGATGGKDGTTGGKDSTSGGAAASNGSAGETTSPEGGDTSGGSAQGGAAGANGSAGEAGQTGTEIPPYDCVLKPKTHLDIINACTDATRVEKHPDLPAIP